MSGRKHFEIALGPVLGNASSVVMDGEKLTNVRAVEVSAAVGQPTTVLVEFVNVDVNVMTPPLVEVTTAEDAAKSYVEA